MSTRAKRPAESRSPANSRPRRTPLLIWGAIVVAPVVAAIGAYAFIATRTPAPAPETTRIITSEPALVTKVESLYNDI